MLSGLLLRTTPKNLFALGSEHALLTSQGFKR
jgi:hypothetical protein